MAGTQWPGTRLGYAGEHGADGPAGVVGRSEVRQQVAAGRIAAVTPTTFREARTVGEYFREGVPVVVNLTGMDHADAKRVVDFVSGLVFSRRGQLERLAQRVFLLLPPGMSLLTGVPAGRREDDGFFNQS